MHCSLGPYQQHRLIAWETLHKMLRVTCVLICSTSRSHSIPSLLLVTTGMCAVCDCYNPPQATNPVDCSSARMTEAWCTGASSVHCRGAIQDGRSAFAVRRSCARQHVQGSGVQPAFLRIDDKNLHRPRAIMDLSLPTALPYSSPLRAVTAMSFTLQC